MSIEKGTYVKILKDYLKPEERLETLPEVTKKTPLKGWVKGKLLKEGELNDEAPIETLTGRFVLGKVIDVEPSHSHTFGGYVKELEKVRETIIGEMWGEKNV